MDYPIARDDDGGFDAWNISERNIDSRDRWVANKNPGHLEENNDVMQPIRYFFIGARKTDRTVIILWHARGDFLAKITKI